MSSDTRFFEFWQNNSFGRWKGPGIHVVIEAASADQANKIAQTKGIYFDSSIDCPCCGSRWSKAWHDEQGSIEPTVFGVPIEEVETWPSCGSGPEMPDAIVFFLDGTKKEYSTEKIGPHSTKYRYVPVTSDILVDS